jgi:hypothetical protein
MTPLWFWNETKQLKVLRVMEWQRGIDTRFYRT